ncbi:hypothetical protein K9L67_00010 [Candidatus Woesearchaeota archaeon]|nr:hypothetical protein [Candidatus Woesearchaeota archaeon]MCF7900590.1 hypothetical protein [Candidatus Woesearchaeota archaeon]MCF8013406.1 hypothetical protein [Candidatus Woesearchaeota archaeon]
MDQNKLYYFMCLIILIFAFSGCTQTNNQNTEPNASIKNETFVTDNLINESNLSLKKDNQNPEKDILLNISENLSLETSEEIKKEDLMPPVECIKQYSITNNQLKLILDDRTVRFSNQNQNKLYYYLTNPTENGEISVLSKKQHNLLDKYSINIEDYIPNSVPIEIAENITFNIYNFSNKECLKHKESFDIDFTISCKEISDATHGYCKHINTQDFDIVINVIYPQPDKAKTLQIQIDDGDMMFSKYENINSRTHYGAFRIAAGSLSLGNHEIKITALDKNNKKYVQKYPLTITLGKSENLNTCQIFENIGIGDSIDVPRIGGEYELKKIYKTPKMILLENLKNKYNVQAVSYDSGLRNAGGLKVSSFKDDEFTLDYYNYFCDD